MANRIHSHFRCLQGSVSGGVRNCCQNCFSMSRSRVMRFQSFADFQGSGWKLVSFLPWSSNIVTALANGARQGVSQAGSFSVFSLAHLTLSLPWLMELCRGWVRPDSLFQGSPTEARPGLPAISGVRPTYKTSNSYISAPGGARAILIADLDTWQGRLQNFKRYTSCHYGKWYTVHNYTILLLYTILLYGNWYTNKICMFVSVFQYTSLFTVYDSLLIRFSAYMILRSYNSPLIRFSASPLWSSYHLIIILCSSYNNLTINHFTLI